MDDGITKNSPTSDRTQEEPNDLEGLVADTLSKWNHEDGSKKPMATIPKPLKSPYPHDYPLDKT